MAEQMKRQMVGMTTQFAYIYLRHVYLPPEEGGVEASKNEWIKVEVNTKRFSDDKTVVTYPNAKVPYAASAIILASGTILKFKKLPKSYLNKKADADTLAMLDKMSWDIREMRCADCPEFPWSVLMDGEMIDMRIADAYGSHEKFERFYSSNASTEIDTDLDIIRDKVLVKPNSVTL